MMYVGRGGCSLHTSTTAPPTLIHTNSTPFPGRQVGRTTILKRASPPHTHTQYEARACGLHVSSWHTTVAAAAQPRPPWKHMAAPQTSRQTRRIRAALLIHPESMHGMPIGAGGLGESAVCVTKGVQDTAS